jgi:hypothetical protein
MEGLLSADLKQINKNLSYSKRSFSGGCKGWEPTFANVK